MTGHTTLTIQYSDCNMPNIPTPEVTFAFSKRQDAWTTRYSFVQTCYANCSDEMLSFKDGNGKVWLHDVNPQRNTFYGGSLAPSSLELSFNDAPSAVKIFKSVSLETNADTWMVGFSTNEEYEDENNQNTLVELQELNDKEGFKYFEVPRSASNSTANLVPTPAILYAGGGNQQIQDAVAEAMGLFLENQTSDPILITVPLDEVSYSSFLSTPFGIGVEAVAYFEGSGLLPIPQGMYNFQEFFTYLVNQQYYVFEGAIPFGSLVSILDIGDGSMTFRFVPPLTLIGSDEILVGVWFAAVQGFLLGSSAMFANSPTEINGDQMRGPYLNSRFDCFSDKPVELHSVNVDYEFSSSAARLTQNS